jgi:hypothetical protein
MREVRGDTFASKVERTVGETDAYLGYVSKWGRTNGEWGACLGIEFKPSIRGEHQNGRRAKRVFRGKQDAKVVETSLELCAGRTTDGTVPFLEFANKDPGGGDQMWV